MRCLKNLKVPFVFLFATALFCSPDLYASDEEAVKCYSEGHELYMKHDFYHAAKKFEETERLASDPAIKANSLVARIGAWRMCNMIYRELGCIDALLSRYPEYADYKLLSERIYEIGDRYYAGEREPAYWYFRAIPWLNNGDKTVDIYQKALERAPFSPSAPRARLRLAYLYDNDGKVSESIVQLREIIRNFPDSREYRYSILALAEALFIKGEQGDGDGRLVKEAFDMLKLYEKKYPQTGEMAWVRRRILQYNDMQAKKLFDMAEFYEKNDRKDASRRYYADVLSKYPESVFAVDAEKKLISLDSGYMPEKALPVPESRLPELRSYKIPQEASRILISPATDVDTHYLRPVMDLKGPAVRRISDNSLEAKEKKDDGRSK